MRPRPIIEAADGLNPVVGRQSVVERKMGARSMVVLDVGRQDAAQMALVGIFFA
jgi:hypothetical protein